MTAGSQATAHCGMWAFYIRYQINWAAAHVSVSVGVSIGGKAGVGLTH